MQKRIIEYSDNLYPQKLKELKEPPSRLYVKGNTNILQDNGIAVIGSRSNTKYGEKMCKQFTQKLVEYNLIIISGLAVGIDSIAHKTCLKYSGKTIAVLPCGLNNIYPKQNIELLNNIIENGGLVITEYEDNTKADSTKFLERNRIVAGLGIGTLVIEAGYRSGTSVTARYTQNLNKPVFCIPSSLENSKGRTTNELIKKGNKLVTKIEDILECYPNINFTKSKIKKEKKEEIKVPKELLDIYKNIKNIPQDINQISKRSKLSIQEISYKLLLLQMEDFIEELPGKRYKIKEK